MAEITGYSGQIDFGVIVDSDVSYHTTGWSLDLVGDTHDITDFTSSGWRRFLAGLKGWSGSFEMFADATNSIVPSDVGSNATLKLYINSTNYLSGNAICTGWHHSTAVDGVQTISMDFQGNSDLSYT